MRVLVTGSSGLIGQWVCGKLKDESLTPVGLDVAEKLSCQSWLSFYQCSIMNKESLSRVFDEVQPDAVIHLAARIDLDEKHDLSGYSANIDGVRNILNCVRNSRSVRRVIVTSSQLVCKVGYIPQNDTDYCPNTLYGQSKVETEKITSQMDGGGKEWCIVRPTTVWGPGMSSHYQNLLKLIHRGWYFHCGPGKLYKSYSYVGNIAFQYLKMLLAPTEMIHRQTFYLADYEPLSLRDYTNELARVMNASSISTMPLLIAKAIALAGDGLNVIGFRRFPFNSFCLWNILTEYRFDMSKTRQVCEELPFSFDDGVKATAEWYLGLYPE